MLIDIGHYYTNSACVDTKSSLNCHMLLLGGTGAGKTVEEQRIACEIVNNGETALVFDMHHCFDDEEIFNKYAETFNAGKAEINVRAEGIRCNLLEPMVFADGTVEDEWGVISSASDVFKRTLRFGVNQEALLREALYSAKQEGIYEKEGIKCLDSILARSEERLAKNVRERLRPLTMPNIFRPGDDFIKKGKINILRLSSFDLGTQELVAELVLSFLWRQANALLYRNDPLYVFVDEFQNLPQGRNSPLSKIMSEGRKLGLNLVLATQQISAGTLTVMEQRMQQCGTILYFRPDVMSTERIAKMIDREKFREWVGILRELRRGEFIAVGNLTVNNYRIDTPIKVSAYQRYQVENSENE